MTVVPDIRCVPDIARAWARNAPQKAALIDRGRVVTYAQLDDRSNRIANTLAAAGVRPGSHIGYLGKNSAAFFEIWMGVNKAGRALAPLNWRSAAAELVEVAQDANLTLIFAGREFADLAERVRQAVEITMQIIPEDELDQWFSRGSSADPGISPTDSATSLLGYTSGTTAAPKGVPITHGALRNWFRAAATEPSVKWNSDDVALTVMPNFHLAGTLVSLPALYHGASLATLPAFDPAAFIFAVAEHRPTVTCLVPTAMQMLLDHKSEQPADFSSLRKILYAGSPIGQHTLQQALEVFGCEFVQFYGTTETFIITLLRPEQHRLDNPDLLRSCGQPMPGVELRIVDPKGFDVPDGATGEVLVRSPWMFSGYWNKPDATAAAIVDGWYHTGDAGIRDKDGNLFLVDRLKDMIVSGGENIYSAEVERALAAHPSVQSVAVVGAPDQKWGERVVAFVVPYPDRPADVSELVSHCRGLIAGYKVPKEIHVLDALPQTASGKVQKAALRQQLLGE
ncbi:MULTISPECIES: long-chain-fatty-acid--CoA ligase [Mycobacterium]|uniref:Acyl-CoA synthetase n=1 Tax=Mycobacterium paragordonae TaxID=1389713 RepID=A0ABQ1CF11_9MYCO|nr:MULTISPECIES: long-chain-fatty-acid--CoA ligase [Mycobacterium]GFG82854.1 acyl-CoA synthetase [Mycobacterium paragordonae]